MVEEYPGPYAPTNPAPKQGFAHDGEPLHDHVKEHTHEQGSLFTYTPMGVESEHKHHDRHSEKSEHPLAEMMAMLKPLIKQLREPENEYANEKGFDDIERIEDELEGWLGYRDLAKKDSRYKHVSRQEFGHMLLAIQDLLHYIYEETRECPEERQELYNFIHMIKG